MVRATAPVPYTIEMRLMRYEVDYVDDYADDKTIEGEGAGAVCVGRGVFEMSDVMFV